MADQLEVDVQATQQFYRAEVRDTGAVVSDSLFSGTYNVRFQGNESRRAGGLTADLVFDSGANATVTGIRRQTRSGVQIGRESQTLAVEAGLLRLETTDERVAQGSSTSTGTDELNLRLRYAPPGLPRFGSAFRQSKTVSTSAGLGFANETESWTSTLDHGWGPFTFAFRDSQNEFTSSLGGTVRNSYYHSQTADFGVQTRVFPRLSLDNRFQANWSESGTDAGLSSDLRTTETTMSLAGEPTSKTALAASWALRESADTRNPFRNLDSLRTSVSFLWNLGTRASFQAATDRERQDRASGGSDTRTIDSLNLSLTPAAATSIYLSATEGEESRALVGDHRTDQGHSLLVSHALNDRAQLSYSAAEFESAGSQLNSTSNSERLGVNALFGDSLALDLGFGTTESVTQSPEVNTRVAVDTSDLALTWTPSEKFALSYYGSESKTGGSAAGRSLSSSLQLSLEVTPRIWLDLDLADQKSTQWLTLGRTALSSNSSQASARFRFRIDEDSDLSLQYHLTEDDPGEIAKTELLELNYYTKY